MAPKSVVKMPACEGLPNAKCPSNARGDDVSFTQGDLWLCLNCENVRFQSNVHNTNVKQVNSDEASHLAKTQVIVQPMLTYIVYALQSGTADKVKNAVLGYFANDQIQGAKDCLWENCNTPIIGDKQRRKDSSVRSDKEANVQDIINAISKLDEKEKMPCFAIDAYSLYMIPRSHPEELCDI